MVKHRVRLPKPQFPGLDRQELAAGDERTVVVPVQRDGGGIIAGIEPEAGHVVCSGAALPAGLSVPAASASDCAFARPRIRDPSTPFINDASSGAA